MNPFDYSDYKSYVNDRLDNEALGGGRGARARMSKAVTCQTAYTAQVLRGDSHFSLEQAEEINKFFGHSDDEGLFFILLVQWSRSGSHSLRDRFKKQMDELKQSRENLKNRLKIKQILSAENQAFYYSSWYYATIHMMSLLPQFQSTKAIAEHLNLDLEKVTRALEFLAETGLIKIHNKGFSRGTGRIHLSSDSPLISKHHANWRLQAIRSLEKSGAKDLHFSSVVTLSEKDADLIRANLVSMIEKTMTTVAGSKDEKVQSFSLDFFEV